MTPVKLLLVDDHEIVRAGLRMLFSAEPDVRIVGEATSGREAIEQVREDVPGVLPVPVVVHEDLRAPRPTSRPRER